MKTCPTCQQTYSDDADICPQDGTQLPVQPLEAEARLAAGLSRRYRIVRRLSGGGMGTVYLAEQTTVGNRPVALKVLSRALLDNPGFLQRFRDEAASTGRIHHANVVIVYESGQAEDGTPYIAMEFLEGESLRQALSRRGPLPVREVAEILQQAARGLSAAHKLGFIHRDLKPDNIFLTYPDAESVPLASSPAQVVGAPLVGALDGTGMPWHAPTGRSAAPGRAQDPPLRPVGNADAVAPASPPANLVVKIVDFGIAKLRESATHTLTGTVLGTPAYMSYEQASGMKSDELDPRSDVYSLGVVAYEMLTGRLPFQSDTPVGYLRKHLQDAPPPFRTVNPDLPAAPEVESVVMKALTKDRDARYGSVLEFARELSRAAGPAEAAPAAVGAVREPPLRDQATVAQPATPARALAAVLAAKAAVAKRPRVALLLGALLVALSLGVGGWYLASVFLHQGSATPPLAPTLGTVWENPKDGLRYVWVPPGTFIMGCSPGDTECADDEKPAHRETIRKGFWMGQTPVTIAAFKQYGRATGKSMPTPPSFNSGWTHQDMPIVNVSWDVAVAFCGWAGGRLPTEAEWEYAARAGSTGARYAPIDEVAWYANNSGQTTHQVALKRVNAFGLYDMLGNVWEWVNDYWSPSYPVPVPPDATFGPPEPIQGPDSWPRVVRGGSWFIGAPEVRASRRFRSPPDNDFGDDFGLRCVREVARP